MTYVTRDMMIGKLTAFELSEFGETPPKSESAFKVIVSRKLKYNPGESSTRVSRHEKEMIEIKEEERDLEELEV